MLFCSLLDFLNVMTFDLQGSWQSTLEHHSPLYPRSNQIGDERFKNVVGCFCNLFHCFRSMRPCDQKMYAEIWVMNTVFRALHVYIYFSFNILIS